MFLTEHSLCEMQSSSLLLPSTCHLWAGTCGTETILLTCFVPHSCWLFFYSYPLWPEVTGCFLPANSLHKGQRRLKRLRASRSCSRPGSSIIPQHSEPRSSRMLPPAPLPGGSSASPHTFSPQVRGSPLLRGSRARRAGAAEGRRAPCVRQGPGRVAAGHVPCHRQSRPLPQQLRDPPLQVCNF